MIRLNLPREPYWLPLDGLKLRLQVRPISTAVMDAAQARAVAMSAEIALQRRALREAGHDVGHLPDLDDPVVHQGVGETVALKALARSVLIDWEGVFQPDGVTPAAVTEDTVNQLMGIWPVARAFRAQYVAPRAVLDTEKKRIHARAKWHWGGGAGYCGQCHADGLPCARGERGGDGKRCPNHEHRPLTMEGAQAWHVLTSAPVQVGPSGRVLWRNCCRSAAMASPPGSGTRRPIRTTLLSSDL